MISNPKDLQVRGAFLLACVGQLPHGTTPQTGGCIWILDLRVAVGRSSIVSIICHEAVFKCPNTSPERIRLDPRRTPSSTHGQVSPLCRLGIPFTSRGPTRRKPTLSLCPANVRKGADDTGRVRYYAGQSVAPSRTRMLEMYRGFVWRVWRLNRVRTDWTVSDHLHHATWATHGALLLTLPIVVLEFPLCHKMPSSVLTPLHSGPRMSPPGPSLRLSRWAKRANLLLYPGAFKSWLRAMGCRALARLLGDRGVLVWEPSNVNARSQLDMVSRWLAMWNTSSDCMRLSNATRTGSALVHFVFG